MTLKKTIINVMKRDTLKAVVDELELDGVDRRSVEDMAGCISRAHRATPKVLLKFLSASGVKQMCEHVGLSSTGRRGALVKALLREAPAPGRRGGNPKQSHNPGRNPEVSERKERRHMNERVQGDPDNEQKPVRLPAPPPGMIRVDRTELVWPGKYAENGTLNEVPRVNLPFQVIETVNESRATREAKKAEGPTLFDLWEGKEGDTFEAGWKNKLIWGDNLLVMASLLEKFAGKIDVVYIDPPFATGADFSFTAPIGESGEEVFKEQSVIEEKAYRDTWGGGTASYVAMMSDRLRGLRDLLSQKGTLYVHCDWHVNHLLRGILDDVFGPDAFVNEIAWHYFGFKRKTAHNFPRKHDTVLVYANSDEHIWNVQYNLKSRHFTAR